MISTNSYQAKQFNLSGLNGISDQTLEMHFKLYEGYVKETNKLTEKVSECLADGKVDQEEMPARWGKRKVIPRLPNYCRQAEVKNKQ
jgi:Fe-Mn family superoxide dismutase